MPHAAALFDRFRMSLGEGPLLTTLHDDLIGQNATINGPFGAKKLLYADYVASGRALKTLEHFVLDDILPFYANSHTEASYVGGMMTRLRREARQIIARCCGADERHAVVFTGSGATAGINRLVHLLGLKQALARGERVIVLQGPYEHHSNILPWRESGAEIIEISEADCGGPDLDELAGALARLRGKANIIGAFSAASNVTGIVSDVVAITRLLQAAGAKSVWDYAGGGPYLPMSMTPAPDATIDAIVISPHKFVGGPGASGIMIVRRDAVVSNTPTLAGGGTVRFVSPWDHVYSDRIEAREEAGTPNVIGDLRAALCFIVKDSIGQTAIDARHRDLCARAFAAWRAEERIEILGHPTCERLPVFSFRLRKSDGGYIHQQLATRMLSDCYGIQARGGCACAGPYVHRLLGLDESRSASLQADILSGQEVEKPGFVRLNFSYLATDPEVDFIIRSVLDLAQNAERHIARYSCDERTAIFTPLAEEEPV